MKNIGVAIAVLVLGAGLYIVFGGSDGDSNASSQVSDGSRQLAERYETYSDATFAAASDTERVLFFHAPWCSVCNKHESEILASGVPEGVTIHRANFDTNTALKQQYGVNVQSTFVHVNAEGEVVNRWPFGQGIREITDLYEQVI